MRQRRIGPVPIAHRPVGEAGRRREMREGRSVALAQKIVSAQMVMRFQPTVLVITRLPGAAAFHIFLVKGRATPPAPGLDQQSRREAVKDRIVGIARGQFLKIGQRAAVVVFGALALAATDPKAEDVVLDMFAGV